MPVSNSIKRRIKVERQHGKAAPKAAPAKPEVQARDILSPSHPVHATFARWVKERHEQVGSGEELTVRKARKFLAVFPGYRGFKKAA